MILDLPVSPGPHLAAATAHRGFPSDYRFGLLETCRGSILGRAACSSRRVALTGREVGSRAVAGIAPLGRLRF
jgi:hypothetical protein